MSASLPLDPDRSALYFDLIYASLSEAARQSLMTMDPAKYEFQSEFAKRYLSQGRAEGEIAGEVRGRAETLVKLLTLKFGTLQDTVAQRIRSASVPELEMWTERVLGERSVDDVLR
ncbi:MAG: hypothetical protein RL701_693 [Pseudomonadota bacterium]|jgi:predicted transposase YdaD